MKYSVLCISVLSLSLLSCAKWSDSIVASKNVEPTAIAQTMNSSCSSEVLSSYAQLRQAKLKLATENSSQTLEEMDSDKAAFSKACENFHQVMGEDVCLVRSQSTGAVMAISYGSLRSICEPQNSSVKIVASPMSSSFELIHQSEMCLDINAKYVDEQNFVVPFNIAKIDGGATENRSQISHFQVDGKEHSSDGKMTYVAGCSDHQLTYHWYKQGQLVFETKLIFSEDLAAIQLQERDSKGLQTTNYRLAPAISKSESQNKANIKPH